MHQDEVLVLFLTPDKLIAVFPKSKFSRGDAWDKVWRTPAHPLRNLWRKDHTAHSWRWIAPLKLPNQRVSYVRLQTVSP